MSSSLDTFSDVMGYLIVATVLFAFPVALAIYAIWEVIEQVFRTNDLRKPIPGQIITQKTVFGPMVARPVEVEPPAPGTPRRAA